MPREKKVKSVAEDASNKKLQWAIMITQTGNVLAWPNGEGVIDMKKHAGCPFYPSWTVFEETTTAADMRDLAIKYKVELPKKCTKVDAALFIWDELCRRATPGAESMDIVRDGEKYTYNTVTGQYEKSETQAVATRRKKLSNRMYVVVHLDGQKKLDRDRTLANMTPQAKTCLQMLWEFERDEVSEADFKEKIIKEASRLNTRQDPWRIFQYYRGGLIRDGWIRLV